ncbi:MAG: hypothetical protein IMZ64_12420, partial [Bacteroidetes bacterium]|nr:hypothetical protein [Bacteroidota bacterium]
QKILLIHPLHWFGGVAEKVQRNNPNISVTPNFEQVLAMVKAKEVQCVCLMFSTMTETLPAAVKKIHEVNPDLPLQIWNSGEEPQSQSPNEEYLNSGDCSYEEFYAIVDNFYKGS